jgi:hypothetical protein
MPAVPAPPNPLMEVLRRLGMTLPLPQSPEESALAKSGGVAQSIRDIGGLFKGMVTGPKMSGPADAQDLGGALTMLLPLLGKIVYHGSPHLFKKFDMSKVGTGEGAQAYGHGLYFADSPGVAKTYKALGDVDPRDTVNKIIHTLSGSGRATVDDVYFEMKRYPDLAPFQNDSAIKRDILEAMTGVDANGHPSVAAVDAYRRLDRALPPKQGGTLYEVDLPDDAIAKMLDWDAPMGEQPEAVKQAAKEIGFTGTTAEGLTYDPPGQVLYQGLSADKWPSGAPRFSGESKAAEASALLRERGVPGIRYTDQASRGWRILPPKRARTGRWTVGTPQGGPETRYFDTEADARRYFDENVTRNYVVFDDELPKIVNVQR